MGEQKPCAEVVMKLLLAHAFATLGMVGLIWFVQIVHYPLFAEVGTAEFVRYEQLHNQRTTWVVMPFMLVELACAIALVWTGRHDPLAWTGLVLLGIIWASTFLLQVPQHAILLEGFDPEACRRLVTTNWIRTLGWTARGGIAMWMVYTRSATVPP